MDPKIKSEIDTICRRSHITLDDIQMDLDVREDCPGEFYCMPLMHIRSEDLQIYLEAHQ